MEVLGLLSVPTWLLVILAAVLALFLYIIWPHWTFERLGVPGPKPGLFGILGMLKEKGFAYADQELVRKYGKFVGIYHGRDPVLLIADPELVKQVCIKNFSTFTNRSMPLPTDSVIKKGLVNAVDDHWRWERSILSPTFSSGKMRNVTPLVQSALDRLVENIRQTMKKDNKVEAKALFGAFTMDVIASTGFGLDVDAQTNPDDPFVKNARNAMQFNTRFRIIAALSALFPFLRHLNVSTANYETLDFFKNVVNAVIDDRYKGADTKRRDLLQLMLNARQGVVVEAEDDIDKELQVQYGPKDDKGLTRDEILANSIIFLIAGYETTATTLTHAAYLLATNPDCQRRLAEEILSNLGKAKPTYDTVWKLPYLDNVISETLRLYPPAPRTTRLCNQDHVINDVKIPRGMEVDIAVYYIHHDPDIWPDPEKFDPDRFLPENKARRHPYAWLPFGAGPRNCVGMRLALLEIKMVLATLMQHFRVVTSPDTKIPLEINTRGIVLGPAHDVFLRLEAT